jgi:putative flippase GtrA
VKYVVSGGSAAIVDIVALYVFTDLFGIWYILSAILAFISAFFVSFLLQKYWTFKDNSNTNISFK